MGRPAAYRELIQQVLTEYAEQRRVGTTDIQLLFDTERDHYQVLYVGWDEFRRTYGVVLHVDLKDGKIWIQQDGTEGGIANEFVARGVPKEDIVLAFHAPFKRPYTGFAVA